MEDIPLEDGSTAHNALGDSIYAPLDTDKDEIRLLYINPTTCCEDDIICCSLVIDSLNGVGKGEDVPEYAALSYPWGDPSDLLEICLEGRPKMVTRNLANALRRLRKVSHDYFWIDAVCVDQADLQERADQMILMEMIYQNAVMVYSWLPGDNMDDNLRFCNGIADGLADHSDDVAMWLHDLPGKCEAIDTVIWPAVEAIASILRNEVWQRIWIFQEMVLAEELTFLSRTGSLERGKLERVCKALRKLRRDVSVLPKWWQALPLETGSIRKYVLELNLDPLSFQRSRELIERIDDDERTKAVRGNAREELFYVTRYMKATDPRDMCWGLLGVLSLDMLPSYKHSVEVVYRMFARWLVFKTTSIRLLCDAGIGQNQDNDFGLRSWVPDWSKFYSTYSRERYPVDKGMKEVGIAYVTFTDKKHMLVDGVTVGTVETVLESINDVNGKGPNCRAFGEMWMLMRKETRPHPSGDPPLQVLFRTLDCEAEANHVSKDGEFKRHEVAVLARIFAFIHDVAMDCGWPLSDRNNGSSTLESDSEKPPFALYRNLLPELTNAVTLDAKNPLDELDWVDMEDIGLQAAFIDALLPDIPDYALEDSAMQRLKDHEVRMVLEHFFGFATVEAAVNTDRKLCAALNEAYGLYVETGASITPYLRPNAVLCRTGNGWIGCTGTAVQPGDKLCVLGGCPYPVLLRKQLSHWILVEPCFVHGLMYGQTAQLVADGKVAKQTFEIH